MIPCGSVKWVNDFTCLYVYLPACFCLGVSAYCCRLFTYTLRVGRVNCVNNVALRISACVFLRTLKSNAKKVFAWGVFAWVFLRIAWAFLRIVAGYGLVKTAQILIRPYGWVKWVRDNCFTFVWRCSFSPCLLVRIDPRQSHFGFVSIVALL